MKLVTLKVGITLVSLVIMGAGCSPASNQEATNFPNNSQNSNLPSDSSGNSVNNPSGLPSAPSSTDTSPGTSTAKRVINMTVEDFKFTPSTITVNLGDTVEIHLTSMDGAHGLGLSDFKVNQSVGPGASTVINFVANKKGTFNYICTVPCGPGHRDMTGTLIVN